MPLGEAISRLLERISTEPDPQVALETVSTQAMALTGSQLAFIAVLDEEAGHLVVRAMDGAERRDIAATGPLPVHVGDAIGIAGYVAATGQPFLSGDVEHVPHYRAIFADTKSEMAVPIRDRHGRVVGVVNVESARHHAYTAEQQDFMLTVGGIVALILEREAHEKREEALVQVARAFTEVESEEALIQAVVRVVEHVLRMQACSIFLIDPATDQFVLRGSTNLREQVGQIGYARDEGFTGWVCHQKQPILLHSPQSDPRWRGKYVEIPSEEIASFLAVPIVSRGQGIGAIRILRRKSENPYLDNRFRPDDQRLLQAIAEQLAIGLESVRSTERRIRDERMIAWGELSAKSSHMIGNRVFALKGDLNELGHVLAEPSPSPEDLTELHRSLVVNVQRIEEILHDFRDFVSATLIKREATDVNALIRETAEEVFPKRSEVELRLSLDPEMPSASLDAKRVRRAISELIENALVHTKEGHIEISSSFESDTLRIEVCDSGPGIPLAKKKLVFQPFFSGRARGMGLGLSIVEGIVAAHGGSASETGEEGKGARFVLVLPFGTPNPS
jgi:signal transduction histidine kinase